MSQENLIPVPEGDGFRRGISSVKGIPLTGSGRTSGFYMLACHFWHARLAEDGGIRDDVLQTCISPRCIEEKGKSAALSVSPAFPLVKVEGFNKSTEPCAFLPQLEMEISLWENIQHADSDPLKVIMIRTNRQFQSLSSS